MGYWQNDMKNGPGCVVTLDGVYYEVGLLAEIKGAKERISL